MSRYHAADSIYAVAKRFVDVALRSDNSLFTPGRPIWSLLYLEELDKRYVRNPIDTSASFEEKLAFQLADATPDAIQLMAEVALVFYLAASNIGGGAKRLKIEEILNWSTTPVRFPTDLSDVLDRGIGSGGQGFLFYKWASLAFLITFARRFKTQSPDARDALLSDPWKFRDFVATISTEGGGVYGRETLLHLVFPDTFERIFSGQDKQRLATALRILVQDPKADVDRRIFSIRGHLAARFGPDFDFYETDGARALWKAFDDPWAAFIYWASRCREHPKYQEWERDPKVEIVRRLTTVKESLQSGADWFRLLKKGFGPPNNITSHHQHVKFLDWCEADPSAARELLRNLWEGGGEPLARFAALQNAFPTSVVSGLGNRTSIGSFLLMEVNPSIYPPYRIKTFQRAYRLTGYEAGPQDDELAMYRAGLDFLDQFRAKAAARGLTLSDRLDAQGTLWAVTRWDVPEHWPQEDQDAFLLFRQSSPGTEEEEEEEEPGGGSTTVEPTPTAAALEALAEELLLDKSALEEIADMLKRKGQLVFYGPPGTGKTYVARKLAQALAGDPGRVVTVQFHPAYAYEDFVEGFRPRLKGDAAGFELAHGPLRKVAKRAAEDSGHEYYLIIDELNRGNVAKVFGELYFLLEYRDEPLVLQYSADAFQLPKNLFFIGTMNTADRSIALLDAALRRRFTFVPFFPDRPPIAGLLSRWLHRNRSEMAWVAEVVELANRKLADRNGAIGPSFFMNRELDDRLLNRAWQYEILPLLEDYFFDAPERLKEFDLAKLKREVVVTQSDGSSPPIPVATDAVDNVGTFRVPDAQST